MNHEVRVPDKVTSVNAISDVKSKQERTSRLLTKLNVEVICQAQIFREEKQLFVPFTFGNTE